MDIVIIGSGNVAAVLGRKFLAAGHRILQIVSRNASAASALAYEWDSESANYMTVLNRHADIYLVAVSDKAILEVATELDIPPGKIIVHTAASVPMEILKDKSKHYGVLYPLQSLRKEMNALPEIPLYFDGSDDYTKRKLEELANTVSYHAALSADDNQRLKLHVAAVMVSNFVNHLYVLAEDYCRKEGLSFRQLLPLIEETSLRLKDVAPRQAQTGPAIRKDLETVKKHLDLLDEHPEFKRIYQLLTESIQKVQH